jgi:xanthine dehydrogenase YagT iron-sulfur-binding subunit
MEQLKGGPNVADKVAPDTQEHREDTGGSPTDGSAKQAVTRRDFLVGASSGVAATAAAAAGMAAQKPPASTPPTHPPTQTGRPQPVLPPAASLPGSMRRIKLNINGVEHEAVVDVRESLWETMTYKLGLAGANLGCDRAQCGACTVLLDGRPVNSCAVLSARAGRGQKILTAEGLATGAGVAGLHPIQRTFWQEGGFQCGICTRGFIMSTYALLLTNKSPSRDQIREALAGNICRCGEYSKIYDSVEKAAAEVRKA